MPNPVTHHRSKREKERQGEREKERKREKGNEKTNRSQKKGKRETLLLLFLSFFSFFSFSLSPFLSSYLSILLICDVSLDHITDQDVSGSHHRSTREKEGKRQRGKKGTFSFFPFCEPFISLSMSPCPSIFSIFSFFFLSQSQFYFRKLDNGNQ